MRNGCNFLSIAILLLNLDTSFSQLKAVAKNATKQALSSLTFRIFRGLSLSSSLAFASHIHWRTKLNTSVISN